MLARVLEPEVMDSLEDAADYDAMDHSAVNRVFAEDFLAALRMRGGSSATALPVGEILDLGTGTAQIPIELCRRDSELRLRAVDAAASMLELGRRNIKAAGLANRIVLERVDAKKLPYSDASFTGVISNSIVHHIAEPRCLLAEAVRVLAPHGLVFFRDLLRPADEATLAHLVETYASDCNSHQRQLFADSLRAALTLEEMQSLVGGLGFARSSVAETSDCHWTWFARK